jgi:Protein of unknown function (DUF3309)
MPMLGTVLLVALVLLLIGAVPVHTDGRAWSRSPSGILGAFLVVLLLLTASVRM